MGRFPFKIVIKSLVVMTSVLKAGIYMWKPTKREPYSYSPY
jgi:hypothetical protein